MAYEAYISMEGTKQGKFKGESKVAAHKDKIVGLAFDYQAVAPYDAATGVASGKRQHKPITFTKEWGAASPQIYQSLFTNEVLKSVLFEFFRMSPEGKETIFTTIKLTTAHFVSINAHKALSGPKSNEPIQTQELEVVSLVFHKIEIDNVIAKTMAADDWAH